MARKAMKKRAPAPFLGRLASLALTALLAACYADLDWRKLAPEEADFIVLMPARSRSASNLIAGGVTMTQWTASTRDALFGVGFTDYPGGAGVHLNAARDALARNVGGAIIEDRVEPTPSRLAGVSEIRAVTIRGSSTASTGEAARALTVHERLHVRGVRLYQLAVIARPDALSIGDLDTFFSSFELR
jgi:hypothetical protein